MAKDLEAMISEVADAASSAVVETSEGAMGFCDYWPIARPVLENLKRYLRKLDWVLDLLIRVGDAACGGD